ncbi:MAG: ABC transporter ATP-binding protein, partial [Chitinophagaceae bacterium]|nr:ABC transporter ATP-binding protein [Chitinophagaceae bacterium]
MLPLLQIKNLRVDFETETGTSHAVNEISFTVNQNEIVAIVGESGSGKSVTALSILQLLPSSTVRYLSGEILFNNGNDQPIDMLRLPEKQLRAIRGNEIAMIFQEPMTSLNPVFTCG